MPHDQQRPLGPVAFQPRDQIGARRVFRDQLDLDAFGVEYLLYVLGNLGFVARRIGAVDPHQRLEMAHGFVVHFGPIGRLSAGRSAPQLAARIPKGFASVQSSRLENANTACSRARLSAIAATNRAATVREPELLRQTE